MSVVKRLKKAAATASVSTNVLSGVSGYSRSTFSYWFRDDEETRREPRGFRLVYLGKLAAAVEAAYKAGELPAEPNAAIAVIRRRVRAAQ